MKLRTFTQGMLGALVASALLLASPPVNAKTRDGKKQGSTEKKDPDGGKSILRVPRNAFEVIRNRVSNIDFYSSNYGIFGLNVVGNSAGGIWPRGSNKAYIFGGGIWFGAQKVRSNDGVSDTNSLCVIGYNPNSGASWMVPGRIDPNVELSKSVTDESAEGISKYRLYMSTDYNNFSGEPFDAADLAANGPNWPIWDVHPTDTLKYSRYFGNYIDDITMRNQETYPKGPAIISGEDIFSIYKDTDLSRYEKISRDTAIKKGYPIGIQVEQTIYSWGFGDYGNFLFIRYAIINKSGENLLNCYMAPALDMDIGTPSNDHAAIFIPEKDQDTLNLAVQWTDQEPLGASGLPYGYIGFDFLESPAIDSSGYIRSDKRVYSGSEQIGLSTFQAWPIEEDPSTPESRYQFISDKTQRDIDNGPGDKRFLMATGPFNMHPGDTARVVVGIMFAYGGRDPRNPTTTTGLPEDMKNLLAIDTFAQKVYDENFLAPVPPDPANVGWAPLNNGVELSWDDRSERSLDRQERGLDFSSYLIRRTRKGIGIGQSTGSDTAVTGWNLGYKTIASFALPPLPDTVTRYIAARLGNPGILGPWARLPMLADTGARGLIGTYNKFRVDTLKRPGLPDSIVVSKAIIDTGYRVEFAFDPYDDANNDSTLFNDGRYGDQFKNKAIRDIVRDAITAIMDSVTDGRRFIDVGDDNGDGRIELSESDLSQNERLINNVDYYYQVLAYDAGSDQGTPPKINSGIAGLNEVRATPQAPQAGPKVNPTIVGSSGLGGIYNFRFNSLDDDRLSQLFGGDTIDFVFDPLNPIELRDAQGNYNLNYFYSTKITARSRKTGKELMRFGVNYDNQFTDRADTTSSFRLLDSFFISRPVDTGYYDARGVRVPYNGSYTADPLRPVFNTVGIYKNTFSVGFDYAFEQFGDSLRAGKFGDPNASPFTITSGAADGKTNVATGRPIVGQQFTTAGGDVASHIPSIGQPKLEIEFLPGGTETIRYNKGDREWVYPDVPYLTIKVRNIASYTRKIYDASGAQRDSLISYNYEFPQDPNARIKADTTATATGVARTLALGTYGLYAYGWRNSDSLFQVGRVTNQLARSRVIVTPTGKTANSPASYLGTPGRYYVGTQNSAQGEGPLKFTHRLIVNGSDIYLDFAGMGSSVTTPPAASAVPAAPPTTDFQAGDKVVVDFTGGTLGLPQPGAMISVAVPSNAISPDNYTDDLLDKVTVVPNPYLINHIGQQVNTDRRLYFTRLPEKCTIQIYTETGELLQTLTHDGTASADDPNYENGRVSVELWDLLTKSNRLTQSQLLIARITTPNGAETIKKFAVIVGGYRLNNR